MSVSSRAKLQIMMAITLFGLTYGLSAPLIALRLSAEGYSESWIGLNAAMHALGVLLIAPCLPALLRRYSPRLLMSCSLVGMGAGLLLFPMVPVMGWFLLRLLLGMCCEVILVVTETWLNHVTTEPYRARNMATYTAMLSLGFALGPLIMTLQGTGSRAFMLAGLIALLAMLVTAIAPTGRLPAEAVSTRSLRLWLSLLPLALAATVVNAALETAGMSLLPLYAIRLGWQEAQATTLITVLLTGAILLQLPIGWLADRLDRRRMLIALSALSALGALVWPLAMHHSGLAFALLFSWGGVFVGIYTVAITLVGERFKGSELTGAYAVLSVGWGAGALLGPSLGGIAMTLTRHGLPWLAALLCTLFMLAVMRSKPDQC